jgi:hypothetical protein
MSDKYIEDVGISGTHLGPTIQQLHGAKRFTVDFSDGGYEWVTNPLRTVGGRTCGDSNINSLHEKLDEFITRYIKENLPCQ